ncbi:protein PerB [Escherichia coli]|nr:protein PerB [Escherichia coli]EIJ2839169.1 protein PerB [Salmonella enterica]EFE7331069.1 protein PerB [Escherichia coli]EFG6859135.1 protein PerB [Escherichia coli]EFH5780245.1 protein PerB [Escherichia coli]EFK3962866.1 protein PerB [Escherichia coli]
MKNNLREEKEVVFDGCMNVLLLPSGWKAITPKKNNTTSEIIVLFIPPKASYHIILKYNKTKHCELFFSDHITGEQDIIYSQSAFFPHVINHIIALVDILNKKSYASNVIKFLITMEGGGDILSESKRAP